MFDNDKSDQIYPSLKAMLILRYDLKCCCSLGIIFFICSFAYKLLENDIIRKQTTETINLKNGNLLSSDDKKKLKIGRHVTKYKRYKNLSDLKKAANNAIHHCLCSSKQRSSWFDKVRFTHTIIY